LTDDPQGLRRITVQVRKGLGKKLKQIPELKAYHTPETVIERLLRKLVQQDVEIIAVVWRKDSSIHPTDPTVLVLQQVESRQEKALQIADAVAWSIFQKYERGNETFRAILGERIIHEEIIQETKNWLSLGADSHRSMTE